MSFLNNASSVHLLIEKRELLWSLSHQTSKTLTTSKVENTTMGNRFELFRSTAIP
jgi:hypothetical protein